MKSIQKFAFLLTALATFPLTADDGPAADVPELAPLAHYVGDWDMEVTETTRRFSTGEASGQWTLGGRFVEQTGVMTSADGSLSMDVKTLYTFDQQAGVYKSWTFLSTGYTIERTGTWDAETQTFTFTGTANGVTSHSTSDCSNPDEIRWNITSVAADGTETVVNAGTSTPRE